MTTSINKSKSNTLVPEIVKKPVYATWTITILISLISIVYYFISQPQLPIFYSLATKSDQLAQKEFIFLFPTISFLINLIHLFIIKILLNYSSLMLRLFLTTTIILQTAFLLSLTRIVIITI